MKESANRGKVVGIRVAENDHVVRIEGYAQSRMTGGQAMEEPEHAATWSSTRR